MPTKETVYLSIAVFFESAGTYCWVGYRVTGLKLVTVAIALWNTIHIAHPFETLQTEGDDICNEHLKHLSSLGWGMLVWCVVVMAYHAAHCVSDGDGIRN